MRTLGRTVTIVLALCVALVGCANPTTAPRGSEGRASSGGQASAKRLVAVMRGNPFTLSEAINSAGSGSVPGVSELQELIHAGLGVEDSRGSLLPRLAEDLPSVENGLWITFPDGRMETTWKLRPDLVWQDGAALTTGDLAFTVKVAQDRRVALAGDPAYASISSVETPDARTLKVVWSQPYIGADTVLTNTAGSRLLPMPRHLLERAYEEDASTLVQLPYWTHEFVGLGPFKVRELLEGSHMVIVANDRYLAGRPRIDEIQIKFMTDPSAIAANILGGGATFTLGGRYSIEWGVTIRDQWRDGRMETPLPNSWVALFPQLLNPSPPVLSNLQFRRALMHAIDRQEMTDTIQAALSPVGHGIISPAHPEYPDVESSIVRYEFDPRRAAQLIEGLGLSRDAEGMYRDAAGQRLAVELRTRQGDDLQEKTLFGVMGYLQRVGVGVDPFVFPPQRANDREFRAVRPAFEVVRQPSGVEAFIRYHGSETPLPENNFRGINRTRYQSVELDALIDRYLITVPRRERNQIAAQIVRHMTDQLIVYGIYWAIDPVMIGNRLANVAGHNPTWNAHEWDLR